jgi:hypothetical protein
LLYLRAFDNLDEIFQLCQINQIFSFNGNTVIVDVNFVLLLRVI